MVQVFHFTAINSWQWMGPETPLAQLPPHSESAGTVHKDMDLAEVPQAARKPHVAEWPPRACPALVFLAVGVACPGESS